MRLKPLKKDKKYEKMMLFTKKNKTQRRQE
jgi:hypothetical protein